jgi:uncharacterized Zn finger protein (UPF0148 family)
MSREPAKGPVALFCVMAVSFVLALEGGSLAGWALRSRLAVDGRGLVWIELALNLFVFAVVLRFALREARVARAPARTARLEQGARRLEVVSCPGCGAHLALAGSVVKSCDHCGEAVEIPEAHAALVRARERERDHLSQATRALARLGWMVSLPAIVALSVISTLWMALAAAAPAYARMGMVMTLRISQGSHSRLLGDDQSLTVVAIITVVAGCLVGLAGHALSIVMMINREHVPRIVRQPAHPLAQPEHAGCQGCGAPVFFRAGEIAALCTYCGAETYRARLLQRVRFVAEQAADTAAIDAVGLWNRVRANLSSGASFFIVALFVVGAIFVYTALLDTSFVLALAAASLCVCIPLWLGGIVDRAYQQGPAESE